MLPAYLCLACQSYTLESHRQRRCRRTSGARASRLKSTANRGQFRGGRRHDTETQQRRTDGRRRLMGPPDDGRRAAFLWEPVRRLRPAIRPNSPVRAGRRLHQFPRSPPPNGVIMSAKAECWKMLGIPNTNLTQETVIW
jgi:hypothetical protein